MVSKKELAICKRRGHDSPAYRDGWAQCKWCGLWRRKVTTFEEREDEPPEDELDPGVRADRGLARLQSTIGKAGSAPPAKKPRGK
jgi:hypothetical protein